MVNYAISLYTDAEFFCWAPIVMHVFWLSAVPLAVKRTELKSGLIDQMMTFISFVACHVHVFCMYT